MNYELINRWYVMVHHKPKWIDTMLYRESKGELVPQDKRDDSCPPEPFEYLVPYQFMRPDASDELRSIFHHFVFIRASEERLYSILTSDWNTTSRIPLRHYRDKGGTPITISNEEYHQLYDTFMNSQLQIYFGLPVEDIGQMVVGDEVTLLLEGWKGKRGRIERISLKKGKISMVVGVNILGSTKSVNFKDLHNGDVIFSDHYTEQLLTGNLISNLETQIATILGHYFEKHPAEKMRRDFPRLRRFLSYGNIQIDNEDDLRRFTSLMLMCATMLGETDLCNRYRTQIEQWLGEEILNSPFSIFNFPLGPKGRLRSAEEQEFSIFNLTEAYLLLALFVSTRDPRLRDTVKAYRKAHPDCPPIIGTFINKVRNAVTRKPHVKKSDVRSKKSEA